MIHALFFSLTKDFFNDEENILGGRHIKQLNKEQLSKLQRERFPQEKCMKNNQV